jgi:hypothetical protein
VGGVGGVVEGGVEGVVGGVVVASASVAIVRFFDGVTSFTAA